ncbi:MAG: ATP-dependent DNA helicase, partial [Oscillospiraceae bacterium]|nr:ATP-dependent DNA helicase [Oscillospiraceae bacterium]
SDLLRERLETARAAVLFSATLSPPEYYAAVLGAREPARALALPSPFPRENFLPLVADLVSTRYRDRADTLAEVAELIAACSEARRGNYIAFFPSYEYMNEVYVAYRAAYPHLAAFKQESGMNPDAREAFLRRFETDAASPRDGFTAFCVLGGVFSEGVDLIGERVVGVIVVGTGLPRLDAETELLRERFDYDFAYTYPGFNRVLQAAGRLIRTETDRGVALLIDDRFTRAPYPALFPAHWAHRARVRDAEELRRALGAFWNPA